VNATGNAEKAYPVWLETNERLRDGTEVHLRPLRPEDEPLLQDLAAHMSPEDLRLRFFAAVRGLSHAVAERLAHVDYDRAMALVALKDEVALGVARFHAVSDPQLKLGRRAEYAIAVRSDWKGRGLGYLLMTRLIAVAQEWGVSELVGQVLSENHRMLAICRELGFSIAADPNDARIMQVRKILMPQPPPRASA
jgi:acetyltransferase